MYDYLIVGAGLFGSTFAYCANMSGKTCLIVDSSDHIGGNCYTKQVENINVHVYGPHIFHTSDDRIWKFVNEFANFNSYTHRVKAINDNKIYTLPINLMTIHQVYGTIKPSDAILLLNEEKVPCENPRNLEEWILSQVGRKLYETLIYGYTKKQWGQEPSTLSPDIIKRLPIRLTMDDNYFNDTYQGIPIGGYTQIFEKMLNSSKSNVVLSTDFFKERETLEKVTKQTIYTGKIDRFYNYVHGPLNYRSLKFQTQVFDTENYQGLAQLNHTAFDVPWTRSIEHKHFEPENKTKKTVVTWEFPCNNDDTNHPYYPIDDKNNNLVYRKYKDMTTHELRTSFGGRLGTYQYVDMHQVIASAMIMAKKHNLYSIF